MKRVVGFIVFFVLAGLFMYGVNGGLRFIRENNNTQRRAEISLNDLVNRSESFPVGKYVGLDTYWIIGPYASETSTETSNGIKSTTQELQYYFAVLEDGSVMTVASENRSELEAMNRISDYLLSVEGYPKDGESIHLQGNLRKMTKTDLVRLCDQYALKIFNLSSTDSRLRHVYLDTTAGRDSMYLILAGAAALVIIVLFARSKLKKKELPQPEPQTEPQTDASA